MVYIHNGIVLSHKKEQSNAICNNMGKPRDSHTKWGKSEREGQMPYDNTYKWNPNCGTDEPIYKAEIDLET